MIGSILAQIILNSLSEGEFVFNTLDIIGEQLKILIIVTVAVIPFRKFKTSNKK
ncbi:MAG TPA: hypothetical protein GX708_17240 [Gallicola sp.]|uniref:hypothetical protein n=1 Tax=Miniphocaeibacter sp. TaxID=3100973 RepID=UPI001800DA11|nr:hypothetical protein [Gallicola sp.]